MWRLGSFELKTTIAGYGSTVFVLLWRICAVFVLFVSCTHACIVCIPAYNDLCVTGKKSVESFRNHCVIEQKITRKSIEACDFCVIFCSITQWFLNDSKLSVRAIIPVSFSICEVCLIAIWLFDFYLVVWLLFGCSKLVGDISVLLQFDFKGFMAQKGSRFPTLTLTTNT